MFTDSESGSEESSEGSEDESSAASESEYASGESDTESEGGEDEEEEVEQVMEEIAQQDIDMEEASDKDDGRPVGIPLLEEPDEEPITNIITNIGLKTHARSSDSSTETSYTDSSGTESETETRGIITETDKVGVTETAVAPKKPVDYEGAWALEKLASEALVALSTCLKEYPETAHSESPNLHHYDVDKTDLLVTNQNDLLTVVEESISSISGRKDDMVNGDSKVSPLNENHVVKKDLPIKQSDFFPEITSSEETDTSSRANYLSEHSYCLPRKGNKSDSDCKSLTSVDCVIEDVIKGRLTEDEHQSSQDEGLYESPEVMQVDLTSLPQLPQEMTESSSTEDQKTVNSDHLYNRVPSPEPLITNKFDLIKQRTKKQRATVNSVTAGDYWPEFIEPDISKVTYEKRNVLEEMNVLYEFLKNGVDEEDVRYLKRSYDAMLQDDMQCFWLNDTHWVDHAHILFNYFIFLG